MVKTFLCLGRLSHAKNFLSLIFHLRPVQAITIGVIGYIIMGTALLSLPWCQAKPIPFIDNLFSIVSAVSTTGLTTVSVSSSYTFLGQLVLLLMFQIGGWGFMTITSFFFLVVRKDLDKTRESILKVSYTLPKGLEIRKFVVNTVWFSLAIETVGTLLLWYAFSQAGIANALSSAVFHTVSAFATAGFSLYDNSFMNFSTHGLVNIVLSILCYAGAIGFIVIQDLFYGIRDRRKITFTSKVIVWITIIVYVLGVSVFMLTEPSIQHLPFIDRFILASFQVMTASTTAGFNTLDFGMLSRCVLFLIIIVMIIGASPSGTGGGIKTTSVSALSGVVISMVKGREVVTVMGNMIPLHRIFNAVASVTVYIVTLFIGVLILAYTEVFEFEKLFFEIASAIGTVGLSTGITSSLSLAGKINVIIMMYLGRVGPIAIGISIFGKGPEMSKKKRADLAV